MTSPQQITANRENAHRSTGPATALAKERVRLNAVRHGLTGQIVVMSGEDRAAYDAHCKAFFQEFEPVGLLEERLVQKLADTQWRLYRAAAHEANFFMLGEAERRLPLENLDAQTYGALAQATVLRDDSRALERLSIYEQRLNRAFEKAYKELCELQTERCQNAV